MNITICKAMLLLFLIATFSCSNNNNQQIDKGEIDFYPNIPSLLNDYIWKDELESTDISSINEFIDSSKEYYQENELNFWIPILVHRSQFFEDKVKPKRWDIFSEILSSTKGLSDLEYDQVLLDRIDKNKLLINQNAILSHYYSIDDDLLTVLLVRQCKYLREGLQMNVNLVDSVYHGIEPALMSYSKLTKNESIDLLTKEIYAIDSIMGYKEYNLLKVLGTYGGAATSKTFQMILDTVILNELSHNGRSILFSHIYDRVFVDLSIKEQHKLVNFLNEKTIYNEYFYENKWGIGELTSNVTGESLESCHNKLGVEWDSTTRKAMEQYMINNK